MNFTVWKVEKGRKEFRVWHTYSFWAFDGQTPIILNEEEFAMLFPDLDPESIPKAPGKAKASIEAKVIE